MGTRTCAVSTATALLLSLCSAPALSAPVAANLPAKLPDAPKSADVPAPPMALLFGMGAVGLIWGRRLNARKDKD